MVKVARQARRIDNAVVLIYAEHVGQRGHVCESDRMALPRVFDQLNLTATR